MKQKSKKLSLIFSVTIFAVMGVASISPALPWIKAEFFLDNGQIKWLISIFTIPGVLISPVSGILADRYGRKAVLVPALLVFALGGMLCSFAAGYSQLLWYRLIQGIGAAILGSLSITLIGDFFSGKDRIRVIGLNASILSVAVAIYPSIGGLLTAISWRYVFLLPVLAIPIALIILFFLDTPSLTKSTDFNEYFLNLWKVINQKKVWGLFIVNLLVFIILYGSYITFFALLLEQRFHAGSITTGIYMSLMSIVTAFFAANLSLFAKWFKMYHLLIFSSSLYIVSMLLFSISFNRLHIILALLLFGVAHGLMIPNLQTVLVNMTSNTERAAFMSFSGTILRLGQFMGPIIISMFHFTENYSSVFLTGSIIAFIMLIFIILLLIPDTQIIN